MDPGIYDIPFAEYQAIDAISNTALGKLAVSPATYKHWKTTPDEGTSDALRVGRLAHRAILEPDKFEAEFANTYAVKPDGMSFATKEGKSWRGEMKERGLEIISFNESEFLAGAAKAIAAHPIARNMLGAGKAEQSIVAEYNGIRIKARLDWLTDGDTVVDLKTTVDASRWEFEKTIRNLAYYRQAAFYLDACALLGLPVHHFCILAVEKEPPYLIGCYQISPRFIEIGRREYVRLLGRYKECALADKWPGYAEELITVEPPEWMANKEAA